MTDADKEKMAAIKERLASTLKETERYVESDVVVECLAELNRGPAWMSALSKWLEEHLDLYLSLATYSMRDARRCAEDWKEGCRQQAIYHLQRHDELVMVIFRLGDMKKEMDAGKASREELLECLGVSRSRW